MEIKLNKEESNKLKILLICEIENVHYFPNRTAIKIFEGILKNLEENK